MKKLLILLAIILVSCESSGEEIPATQIGENYEIAYFAGGCFWCMEPPFDELEGVISTTVGYMGGDIENPTYEVVSTGKSGHAEVVQIVYDESLVSYEKLIEVYWRNIDPTALNYQFNDYGSQYRTEIFYLTGDQENIAIRTKKELEVSGKFSDPIVTEISKAEEFYIAEDYHQKYLEKRGMGSCH